MGSFCSFGIFTVLCLYFGDCLCEFAKDCLIISYSLLIWKNSLRFYHDLVRLDLT